MATEEHKLLAQYIKEVHSSLRNTSIKIGATAAWDKHCNNKHILEKYAQCMRKLATYWEENCTSELSMASSRIKWAADFCHSYFIDKIYMKFRNKELDICKKINIVADKYENFSNKIKLLDVGSCYNPFDEYDFLDVLALDLCPANKFVLECDFLKVSTGNKTVIEGTQVIELELESFDVVTFCFVLEYIPSSHQRIIMCEKAYNILKPGGLCIINTPDSKHIGANCKIIKNWRYTLACMGFVRIAYEKFKHMHCMAFRKSLYKDTSVRWALIHKEPYMEYSLQIPQDLNNITHDEQKNSNESDSDRVDMSFEELPFCGAELT